MKWFSRISTKVTRKRFVDLQRPAVERLGGLRYTIITLTSEVDEQNMEHSVHYGNTGFLFVQNIIAISPTRLFPFTGRQVTRARNHVALCSAAGFANSAEFQKPQTAHFLFCHDHLLQTISFLVASSHSRPSLC
jgi:hypothetical protein